MCYIDLVEQRSIRDESFETGPLKNDVINVKFWKFKGKCLILCCQIMGQLSIF